MNKTTRIAMGLIVALLAPGAMAQQDFLSDLTRDKVLRLQFSPFTLHFSPSEEHRNVVMVGVERESADGKLDGVTFFTNSFGQPTLYLYPWGGVYPSIGGIEHLSFKWTAGLLIGYREPYENKVPLNYKGFSPGVIPALSYDFTPSWSGQLNFLGTAGLMFQFSKTL